jgi:hypothetical protein
MARYPRAVAVLNIETGLFLAATLTRIAGRNPVFAVVVTLERHIVAGFLLGSLCLFGLSNLSRIDAIANAHIIPAKLSL